MLYREPGNGVGAKIWPPSLHLISISTQVYGTSRNAIRAYFSSMVSACRSATKNVMMASLMSTIHSLMHSQEKLMASRELLNATVQSA